MVGGNRTSSPISGILRPEILGSRGFGKFYDEGARKLKLSPITYFATRRRPILLRPFFVGKKIPHRSDEIHPAADRHAENWRHDEPVASQRRVNFLQTPMNEECENHQKYAAPK